MRTDGSEAMGIAIGSINCFTDDGTLDMEELNFMLGLALRDGKVDEDEKRVLGNIFKRIKKSEVSLRVWERIMSARKQYGIE